MEHTNNGSEPPGVVRDPAVAALHARLALVASARLFALSPVDSSGRSEMKKPIEHLYVLTGNHQQFMFYVKDSHLDRRFTHSIDTVWDIRGVRFNEETVQRVQPRGRFRKKLGLEPKFKEVPAERTNRLVVVGQWRERPDIHLLTVENWKRLRCA